MNLILINPQDYGNGYQTFVSKVRIVGKNHTYDYATHCALIYDGSVLKRFYGIVVTDEGVSVTDQKKTTNDHTIGCLAYAINSGFASFAYALDTESNYSNNMIRVLYFSTPPRGDLNNSRAL